MRLGAARGSELNPFALLASQGVPLALGSDAPVTGPRSLGRACARRSITTPRAARFRRGRPSLPRPAAAGGQPASATARREPWCPARRPPTRCGTPGPSMSARRATPSSAGPPTRDPGCPHYRECTRPTPCRAADKPCIGVRSSMASDCPIRRHRQPCSRPSPDRHCRTKPTPIERRKPARNRDNGVTRASGTSGSRTGAAKH